MDTPRWRHSGVFRLPQLLPATWWAPDRCAHFCSTGSTPGLSLHRVTNKMGPSTLSSEPRGLF